MVALPQMFISGIFHRPHQGSLHCGHPEQWCNTGIKSVFHWWIMAISSRCLTGRGVVSGLGCYFRVYYSLERLSVSSAAKRLDGEKAAATEEPIRGLVEPPGGVTLPVGKAMSLTMEDGHVIRIITDANGEVSSIGPHGQ